MIDLWQYIIPAISVVVVAIIEAVAAGERKKTKKYNELRSTEMLLSMKMINATLQLSIVTANALTNGHNNGNVERARQVAKEAEEEYTAFLQKLASNELS